MTGDQELLSVDESEERLGDLVEMSARNGIRFDRWWTIRRQGDDVPAVMVEITRLHDHFEDT